MLPIFANAQTITVSASADTICRGSTVIFSAATRGVSSAYYRWKINNQTVSGDSASFSSDTLSTGDIIFCELTDSLGDTILATSDSIVISVRSVAPITGPDTICSGTTVTFSDATHGGTWGDTYGNPPNAAGVVTEWSAYSTYGTLSLTTDTITYVISNSCGLDTQYKAIIVEPLPNPYYYLENVAGFQYYCVGSEVYIMASVDTNEHFYATNTNAVIGHNEIYLASTGEVAIIGIDSNYCGIDSFVDYITILPPFVLGPITASSPYLCGSSIITLTDPSAAYCSSVNWSQTNGDVFISSYYNSYYTNVTGLREGTDTIILDAGAECGYSQASIEITVGPVFPIYGVTTLSTGSLAQMYDSTSGGKWHSSNESIASIDINSGMLIALSSGTDTVSYLLPDSCFSILVINVTDSPLYVLQTGSYLCPGSSATMTATPVGGTWRSTNKSISAIDSISGAFIPASYGTDTVVYTLPEGAYAKMPLVVSKTKGGINVVPDICIDSTAAIIDTIDVVNGLSGVWSSTDPAVVYVPANGGVLYGRSKGIVTIYHTFADGCYNTAVVNVADCSNANVVVFPNPSQDEITLQANTYLYFSYSFRNTLGEELFHAPISGNFTNVNVAVLPRGIYFITAYGYNGNYVTRFLKE